jgi:hypothetical protein
MIPVPGRHVLYALLICSVASAPGHTAVLTQVGGQGAQASDSNLKRDAAPDAANTRREPAMWRGEPLKGGDTAARAAALRSRVLRDARSATLHRNFSPLRDAGRTIAKPAISAARTILPRRSDADHPVSRFDPVTAGARGFVATSAGASARRWSPSLAAASGSVASPKALAAGNGVIGGPRAAGRGMIGGAANGKNVFKASIDGTAPRRRF